MTSPTVSTATHNAAVSGQPHEAAAAASVSPESIAPSSPAIAGPSSSAESAATTPRAHTAAAAAPPSSIGAPSIHAPSTIHQKSPRQFDEVSIQYSSFPSAQSPQLTGIAPPPPARPFPFSHEDTEKSRLAYETLASSAKAYRVALGQVSGAASNFGAALEACARLKEARAQPYPPGPYMPPSATTNMYGSTGSLLNGGTGGGGASSEVSCTADVLLATSGLYYLMANQQGILAETVYRSFELPIVHELDRYTAEVEAEQESYAAGIRDASKDIRKLEKEGVKLRKPRQRDVTRMRSHLVAMTAALDALTARQGAHAVALLDQSRDMSGTVSQAGRNLVRAEMDILDGLARKGWPGGGLDGVLEGAVDLFSRGSEEEEDVLASSAVISAGPSGLTGVSDLPKLMQFGGGPVSTGLSRGLGHSKGSGSGGGLSLGVNDDASDTATIEGSAPQSAASTTTAADGGRVFSILSGNSILNESGSAHQDQGSLMSNEDSTPSEKRGRSHKKKKKRTATRATAVQNQAGDETEQDGDENATQPTSKKSTSRHQRADSLTVSTGDQSYYQSLDDALVHAEAGGEDDDVYDDTEKKTPSVRSSSKKKATSKGRGRARPFSPRRVAVDPQEDVFTGAAEGGDGTGAAAAAEEARDEPGSEKGKAAAEDGTGGEEEQPTAAEEESHTEDEGVQAWRR